MFRPSEYDAAVLSRMQERYPHRTRQELLRDALRAWEIYQSNMDLFEVRLSFFERVLTDLAKEVRGEGRD